MIGYDRTIHEDGLGFRVLFEASEDGRSGLLGLERGTIRLTLDSPQQCPGLQANLVLCWRVCRARPITRASRARGSCAAVRPA